MFASTKQLAAVFFSDQRSAFREVVLFEYPRRGSFSLGFVTSTSAADGVVSVFLPTTPNPTTGFLLILPRREVAVTSLTVEEGFRLIITGGAAMTAAQAARLSENAAHLVGSSRVDPGGIAVSDDRPDSTAGREPEHVLDPSNLEAERHALAERLQEALDADDAAAVTELARRLSPGDLSEILRLFSVD